MKKKIKNLSQKELNKEIRRRIDELLPFLEENERRVRKIIKLLKDYPKKVMKNERKEKD